MSDAVKITGGCLCEFGTLRVESTSEQECVLSLQNLSEGRRPICLGGVFPRDSGIETVPG